MLKFDKILSGIQDVTVEMYLLSKTEKQPIFSAMGFFEVNTVFYFMVTSNR
jgi:hypothetical protein